jgi:hypothetical protein
MLPDLAIWPLLIFALPVLALVWSLVLGLARATQRFLWLAAGWATSMTLSLVTGQTRVHGPDVSFIGLVFVTPLMAAAFGLGFWINRKRRP